MTSRHLYFKLLREDGKQKLWTAALLALALFFALPVAMAITLSSYREDIYGADTAIRRLQQAKGIVSFGDSYPLVLLFLVVAAVVIGMATFSYLHNRKQIDFYHSLPVKRSLLFAVHVTTGILIPMAVYLAAAAAAIAVAVVNGVDLSQILIPAVQGYLSHMLFYILIYATVVLAVMMTGTRLAAILGTAVFFWYSMVFSAAIDAFCGTWLETYYYGAPSFWNQVLPKISPIWALATAMSEGLKGPLIVGVVAAILFLFAVSFVFYERRPSEAAGKTMVFKISMPIIKVLLVILFGMVGALFFYPFENSLGWGVFGTVIGVAISHCVIEVVYHADFKKLFCHEKTMAACMAAALAILLSFHYDVFRFDTYVPEETAVREAAIDFDEDAWVTYSPDKMWYGGGREVLLERGTVTDIPALLEVAKEGVRQTELGEAKWEEYSGSSFSQITIRYTLKSGRRVYREYYMCLDPVMEAADRIYGDADYKNVLYPGLTVDTQEAASHLVYGENGKITELFDSSVEARRQVAEAYQQEMAAMTFARRQQENPVGELLLISNSDHETIQKMQEGASYQYSLYTSGYYNGYFYPIYPSFEKTIAALEQCGIQAGSGLTPGGVERILVQKYRTEIELNGEAAEIGVTAHAEAEPQVMTYSDPEQIAAILQAVRIYNYTNKNSMLAEEEGYDVEILLSSSEIDEDRSVQCSFIRGKVPEFVGKDFMK